MKLFRDNCMTEDKVRAGRGNSLRSHFAAFCITGFLMTLFCVLMRITPFGDQTFLYDDLRREFVQYYAYLKTVFAGGGSLVYSGTKGLGGSMLGLFINYMSSPLNLVYVLFPVREYPTVTTVLLVLRLSLSAFTMDLFLRRIGISRSVPFAVSFSLSMWVFVSVLNPLWLDAVVMFPVLAAVLLDFSKDTGNVRRFLALVLLTAFQFYLNYYTAVMMTVFLALWMILRWMTGVLRFQAGLRCAYAMLGGILLMCPVLVPVFRELTKSEKNLDGSLAARLFADQTFTNPLIVFSKLFSLSIDGKQVMFGMPHLFAGTVILPLAAAFFLGKEEQERGRRVRAAVMLLILAVSFCYAPLNLLWHFGNQPNGYPFRYAFLFVFTLVVCAVEGAEGFPALTGRRKLLAFVIPAFLEILVLALGEPLGITWLSLRNGMIGLMILFAEGTLIGFLCRSRLSSVADQVTTFIAAPPSASVWTSAAGYSSAAGVTSAVKKSYGVKKSAAAFLLLALCAADLLVNQMKIVRASYIPCETVSSYQAKYDAKAPVIEQIRSADTGMYRIEDIASDPYDDLNDSFTYNYRSVSHYSTGDHRSVRLFLKNVGFNYNGLYDEYTADNTDTVDAILGIRYLLTKDGVEKNDSTFPLAVDIEGKGRIPEKEMEDNPFVLQGWIADTFSGEEADADNPLFVPAKVVSRKAEAYPTAQISAITFRVKTGCEGDLYFYLKGLVNTVQNMKVSVNGTMVSGYGNASDLKVLNLGHFLEEETVELSLVIEGDTEEADFGELQLFTENQEVLEQYAAAAARRAVPAAEASSTSLWLNVPEEHAAPSGGTRRILLSIPCEEGFHAVSQETGQELLVSPAFGALTQIRLPQGFSGKVLLYYRVPGAGKGMLAGLAGIVMTLGYVLWCRHAHG